jgi:hypothetical protein
VAVPSLDSLKSGRMVRWQRWMESGSGNLIAELNGPSLGVCLGVDCRRKLNELNKAAANRILDTET